jgi:hypothetical protein
MKKRAQKSKRTKGKQGKPKYEWITIHNSIITTKETLNNYVNITLNGSSRYTFLKNLYQQYKITKVYANFIPLVESGTYPNPMYAKFVTDNAEHPTIESCMQTGKYINQRTGSRMYFRLSGRQDDFNYWFNTGTENPTLRLYYYPIAFQDPGLKYTLVVSVLVAFRQPMIPDNSVTKAIKEIEIEKKLQEEEEMKDENEELKELIAQLSKRLEKLEKKK